MENRYQCIHRFQIQVKCEIINDNTVHKLGRPMTAIVNRLKVKLMDSKFSNNLFLLMFYNSMIRKSLIYS